MFSPLPERPGLLIRDPLRYSDRLAVLPPLLARCLPLFDGEHTQLDLRAALVRLTGQAGVSDLAEGVVGSLRTAGFLEDETYADMRRTRERLFSEAAVRLPAHAGGGYPEEAEALERTLDGHLEAGRPEALPDEEVRRRPPLGIAAPHVALEGGSACYGAAYGSIPEAAAERTFVVLGTSHYGAPNRFGLTAKPFATPFGQTAVDGEAVATLCREAAAAVVLEDYCHAVEHSIEFQVLFLQRRFGAGVRVLPILCGPLERGTPPDGEPDEDPALALFVKALASLWALRRREVFWVLGIDMAHTGQRYGDELAVTAEEGLALGVRRADQARLERVQAGDAGGFWALVQEQGDPLRWCGSSALRVFLEAVRPTVGRTLRYAQWNIDAGSVVSFAALAFW